MAGPLVDAAPARPAIAVHPPPPTPPQQPAGITPTGRNRMQVATELLNMRAVRRSIARPSTTRNRRSGRMAVRLNAAFTGVKLLQRARAAPRGVAGGAASGPLSQGTRRGWVDLADGQQGAPWPSPGSSVYWQRGMRSAASRTARGGNQQSCSNAMARHGDVMRSSRSRWLRPGNTSTGPVCEFWARHRV